MQVWRHGPSGEQQLTTLETGNKVEGILADGSVLVGANGRHYLCVPGHPIEDVGADFGQVIVRDGRFITLLGAYALGIAP